MNGTRPDSVLMSMFSDQGERKYLNERERKRFYKALLTIKEPAKRTFVEMIFWTGCRPSEALELTFIQINIEDAVIIFRSLKKRGKEKGKQFRIVPIPKKFAKTLNAIHDVTATQKSRSASLHACLWTFKRQTGWRLMKRVMDEAQIYGIRACARGLRHSFGVQRILSGISAPNVQDWMGHSDIKTTSIYIKTVGTEDRAIARLAWKREAYAAYD